MKYRIRQTPAGYIIQKRVLFWFDVATWRYICPNFFEKKIIAFKEEMSARRVIDGLLEPTIKYRGHIIIETPDGWFFDYTSAEKGYLSIDGVKATNSCKELQVVKSNIDYDYDKKNRFKTIKYIKV